MPNMSGLESTRRIREFESMVGRERNYIVALTAHCSDEDRADCADAGMDGFMCVCFGGDGGILCRRFSAYCFGAR